MQYTPFSDSYAFDKYVFNVSIGENFENYAEAIRWMNMDETFGKDGELGIPDAIQELYDRVGGGEDSPTPIYFARRKCRDTRVGGNDAINCLYAFCEYDDIVHPFYQGGNGDTGMGRVYSNTYDDPQQILWLSAGLIQYNESIPGFYQKAILPDLVRMMNSGSRFTPESLGRIVGSAVATFVLLPVVPLIYIYQKINQLTSVPITKYCDFRPEMGIYYRLVNQIIIHLSVNLGWAKDGVILNRDSQRTGSTTSNLTFQQQTMDAQEELTHLGDDPGLPPIFKDSLFDFYRIVMRKTFYDGEVDADSPLETSDYALHQQALLADLPEQETDTSFLGRAWNAFGSTLYEANLFIGYRITNGTTSSESFSNETMESPIVAANRSQVQALQQAKNLVMNGNVIGGEVGDVLKAVAGGLSGIVGGIMSNLKIDGIASSAMGAAYLDIPKIYASSSISKSHNFQMTLRTPYGHPLAVMQDLYIPLASLFPFVVPRATGSSSYTGPLYCRAYCKGRFAIPFGIFKDMSLERGAAVHGWTYSSLPTVMNITFSIEDLSPVMYMGISDGFQWRDVVGENTSFNEYLMTLSGMGLQERLRALARLRRGGELFLKDVFNQKLNPTAFGIGVATSPVGRIIAPMIPATGLPTN